MEPAKIIVVLTTILSVWGNPVPEKSLETILSLMSHDPNVCKFPPKDVLLNPTIAPFIYSCEKAIPPREGLGEGLAGLRSYADNSDDYYSFLCMGFYDLSLQICKSSLSSGALFNDTKQFNNFFNDPIGDSTFCRDFQPYADRTSSSPVTKDWVAILNENLKDEDLCKSWCSRMRKGKMTVHPICKILMWGRKQLASTDEQLPDEAMPAETSATDETQQYPDSEAGYNINDLEAPDLKVDQPEQSPVVDVSQQQQFSTELVQPSMPYSERLPPIRGTSLPLTHMEIKAPPVQSETPPRAKEVIPPVQNSSQPERVTPIIVVDKSKNPVAVTEVIITPKADNTAGNIKTGNIAGNVKPGKPVGIPKPNITPKVVELSTSVQSKVSESSSTASSTFSSTASPSISTSEISLLPEDANEMEPKLSFDNDNGQHNEDYSDTADQNQEQSPVDNDGVHPLDDDDDEDDDDMEFKENNRPSSVSATQPKYIGRADFTEAEDSHFFAYFLTMIVVTIVCYLVFHNKQKILALVLEGRRGGRSSSRRRPSTSNYRKLDSNLEEAISSNTPRTNPHVIY